MPINPFFGPIGSVQNIDHSMGPDMLAQYFAFKPVRDKEMLTAIVMQCLTDALETMTISIGLKHHCALAVVQARPDCFPVFDNMIEMDMGARTK
ncbi:MAG: Uncharacterised protein [Hyphomonas sp. TMED17]|nr:MAG: Uncharacterised protein [Hyphomonas sp. TMED17]